MRDFLFALAAFALACSSLFAQKDPRMIVEQAVEACGGREAFYAKGSVEYEYIYQDLASGDKDVSIERYVFDGERSWAKYVVREYTMMPDKQGELIQGYNGSESWTTLDGQKLEDPQQLKIADFLRKTNYYWFTMIFKLLDSGVNYEYVGAREVDSIQYDLVKITFGENIGDVQDIYMLYINPQTAMIDQFLFTVLDFGMNDPHLMKVTYEQIDGIKLPANRKYAPADWDGNIKEEKWTAEISTNIVFGKSFPLELFESPE